jgi:hypothetical protein
MKKLALIAAGLLVPWMALAQSYTHQRIGNFDYWNGSNGYSGSGQQIGNQYYYHDNYGSGYGQRIGNFDYYHYTPNYNYGD